jgi:hypothetical protein
MHSLFLYISLSLEYLALSCSIKDDVYLNQKNDLTIYRAVIQMIIAEILFNIPRNLPDVSTFFSNRPARHSPWNQHHDTKMHVAVKIILSVPEYTSELEPITPIVSRIACGFSNDTDRANTICFLVDICMD